ncbi:hypothetical protein [Sporisorium scitamineum]|uniref:Uncharacterized protein n=1 Tax=Sporisorium scitamineum TaxID=49012 RepID=A0A0F7SAM2_9BASI|nr:hypothetical protein [Sporisorium scitamineum]
MTAPAQVEKGLIRQEEVILPEELVIKKDNKGRN